jgi:hypothetical protein
MLKLTNQSKIRSEQFLMGCSQFMTAKLRVVNNLSNLNMSPPRQDLDVS